jgi:hypothetical protein
MAEKDECIEALEKYLEKRLPKDKITLVEFISGTLDSHAMSQIVEHIRGKYGPSVIATISIDVFADRMGMMLFDKCSSRDAKKPPLLLIIKGKNMEKISRPNQDEIEEKVRRLID